MKLFFISFFSVIFISQALSASKINKDDKELKREILMNGEPYVLTKKILINVYNRPVIARNTSLSGVKIDFEKYESKNLRLMDKLDLLTDKLVELPYLLPVYADCMLSKDIYLLKDNAIPAQEAISLFEKDIAYLENFKKNIYCKKHAYYYGYYYRYYSDYYNNRTMSYYNHSCRTCNLNQKKAKEIHENIQKMKKNMESLKTAISEFEEMQNKFKNKYKLYATKQKEMQELNKATQALSSVGSDNEKIKEKLTMLKNMLDETLITEDIHSKKVKKLMQGYKKENISIKDNLKKLKQLLESGLISKGVYKNKTMEFMDI